jgi:hypothetical protein
MFTNLASKLFAYYLCQSQSESPSGSAKFYSEDTSKAATIIFANFEKSHSPPWSRQKGNSAHPSQEERKDTKSSPEVEENISETELPFYSMMLEALDFNFGGDDQLIDMALCGHQDVRQRRHQAFELMYKRGGALYMQLTCPKVSILAPEDQLTEVMRVVDSKMRRLKHLQMLIELLRWDSKATGNFMSCNPLLADDHSMKNSRDHLDRVVMSFFDLNEFIDVAGFLVWEYMVDRGWLVFNFNG